MTNVRPLTRATPPSGPAPARATRGDEPQPKAALRWLRHTREIEAVMFAMVAAVALLAYRDVFGSVTDFIGPTAGAVAGGAAVGLLSRGRRFEPYAYLVSLGLGSLFIIYAVLPSTLSGGFIPGATTWRALGHGVANGFSSVLGDTLPVTDRHPPLVLVAALAWLVGHVTVDLCVRTKLVAVPLIPPIVLFGVSLPLTAPAGGPSTTYVALFVGLCLLAVLLRATPDYSSSRRDTGIDLVSRAPLSSRLTLGLPLVAVFAVLCPVIAFDVVTRDPYDPRDLRNDVVASTAVIDPLGEYKSIVSRVPAQSLFRATLSGGNAVDVARLPAITLDSYDGVRWTASGRFSKPRAAQSTEAANASGPLVTAHVFVGRLPNQFLPTIGAFENIDLTEVLASPTTGDIFTRGSTDGQTYVVTGRLVNPSAQAIADAPVAVDKAAAADTTLGSTAPDDIVALANSIVAGAGSAGQGAILIADYLRTNYVFDETAPSGSSYGRLHRFLFDDKRGTAEQFAAAFGVLSRIVGYPTRVVLGYRIIDDKDGVVSPLEDITTANYHVWDEVELRGLGWVPIDPTPKAGQVRPPVTQPASAPTTVNETGGGGEQPGEVGPSEAPPKTEPSTDHGYLRLLTRAAAGVGLLLIAFCLLAGLLLAAKRVRRTRRRNGPPAARITGAWEEVVDRLAEVGFELPPSNTPTEVVDAASARFGNDTTLPIAALARDLNRAVFGRDEPSEQVADAAWSLETAFERNLSQTLTRRGRMVARLSVAPLLGHHNGAAEPAKATVSLVD